MSNKWYPASTLTGGTEGCLDTIEGSILKNGDRAIVITEGEVSFYILNETSGATEDIPRIISPITNPGDKRWERQNIFIFLANLFSFDDMYRLPVVTAFNSLAIGDGNVVKPMIGSESYSSDSVCLGGNWNTNISDDGSCSLTAGSYNILNSNGYSSMSGGLFNKLMGICAFSSGGEENVVLADYSSIVGGVGAITRLPGQESLAMGYFNDVGDAQCSKIIGHIDTYDSTPDQIYLNNSNIYLYENNSFKFSINIVARQIDGTSGTVGDSASWSISGLIKNIGAARATGIITFSGALSDGDTITIKDHTYTFRESPSDDLDVLLDTTGFFQSFYLFDVIPLVDPTVRLVGSRFGTFVTTWDAGTDGNSCAFTASGVNISVDGSGTLGGTTTGAYGTLSIVGTPSGIGTPEFYDAAASTWSVAVSADNTNHAINIQVTGEDDKEIHWVASMDIVEVG
jgi:hypothetical protein